MLQCDYYILKIKKIVNCQKSDIWPRLSKKDTQSKNGKVRSNQACRVETWVKVVKWKNRLRITVSTSQVPPMEATRPRN